MSSDNKPSPSAFDQTEESIRVNKAARKILNELESAGIIDFQEEAKLEAEAKKHEGLSGEMLLKIFAISAGSRSSTSEVQRATKLIGSRKLTCNQAKVICQNFHYSSIHPKPFLTGIMLNISDPENVSGLARAVLGRSEAAAFVEKFEMVTSSGVEHQEPETSTVREIITVTKKLNLPAKIGLASIPVMILIIILLMGIIIL
jgi:hypothetical protein